MTTARPRQFDRSSERSGLAFAPACAVRAAFSNSGVSGIWRRTQKPSPAKAKVATNGIRHPQSRRNSSLKLVSTVTVSEDANSPMLTPKAGKELCRPRVLASACS